MAQVTYQSGSVVDFTKNLPAVPQSTLPAGFPLNHLEKLIAIVVATSTNDVGRPTNHP